MRIYGPWEDLGKESCPIFVSLLFYTDVVFTVSCNHLRATEYYVKTVTEDCPNPWTGHPCGSYLSYSFGFCNGCGDGGCPLMGYRAEETKLEGEFFLNTDTSDTLCRELFSLLSFICMPESPSVGSIINVGNRISRLKTSYMCARLKMFFKADISKWLRQHSQLLGTLCYEILITLVP